MSKIKTNPMQRNRDKSLLKNVLRKVLYSTGFLCGKAANIKHIRFLCGKVANIKHIRDIEDWESIPSVAKVYGYKLTEIYKGLIGFTFAVEQSIDGIAIGDLESKLTYVNEAFAEMHGYSPEEMIGMKVVNLHNKEQMHQYKRGMRQIKTHGSWIGEIGHIRKDGTSFPTYVSVTLLKDPEGETGGIVLVCRDITERNRAEEALRMSDERYRTLFESSRDGIARANLKGFITECNQAYADVLGYSREEFKKIRYQDITPSRWHEFNEKIFQEVMERGYSDVFEKEYIKKDGTVFPVSLHAWRIDEDGKPVGVGSIVRDITERKRAEEALRESEERFRQFFENQPEYCYIVSPEGVILDVNIAALKALGYRKEELVGKHLKTIYAPESHTKVEQLFPKWKKTGRLRDKELVIISKTGEKRTVLLSADAVRDKDGKILHSVSMQRDISERKKAEQKLLEDQVKLKSLTSQLTLAEERERRRIATELHDRISQSLVISKMNLEALRKSEYGKETDETLDEICNSLAQTIADTRTLTFDLSSPILYELGFETAVAEWLTEQIRDKHGIATQFEDDGQPKPLDDDIRVLLFRDVRELLINVVRHAWAKKTKVSIRKVDEQICVSVEDDGVGFDPAEAASMAAKRAEFGLFSIRQRLEELGGHLEIKSEPCRGCKVTMTAPLKQE